MYSMGEPTYGNIAWFVVEPKLMHGFEWMQHEETEEMRLAPDPSIRLCLASSTRWEFKFRNSEGDGFIRVGKECNYNPFAMIEALFHQLEQGPVMVGQALKDAMSGGIQMTDEIEEWDDEFKEEWE